MKFLAMVTVMVMVGRSKSSSDPSVYQSLVNDKGEQIELFPDFPLGIPDPENEIPGEPLTPQDFSNAMTISLEPNYDDNNGDPIALAGKFEGDIAGVIPHDMKEVLRSLVAKSKSKNKNPTPKNAIKDMTLRWPEGVIPYVISSKFSVYERSVIARAIIEYRNNTCLRFVPRTSERDYVHIMSGAGCFSHVGRTGGAQPVSLGRGCVHVGIAIHELMHAAGFWHEQSRADRDEHIMIMYDNIADGMSHNFLKYNLDRIQHLGMPYDTDSVMHYDAYAFAKNPRKPTIVSRKPGAVLGQRKGFSEIDKKKLNRLYECGSTDITVTATTPLPLVSTELPGKCEDTNKYCKTWASTGECDANAAWMSVSCRESCKQCDVNCANQNIHCTQWAKLDECTKNEEYMNLFCPQACGVCGEGSTACVDENRYCSAWASRGQCESNPDWMHVHCRKSCAKC